MTGAFCRVSFVRYFLSTYLLSIHVYGILCSGGFPVKVMQAGPRNCLQGWGDLFRDFFSIVNINLHLVLTAG